MSPPPVPRYNVLGVGVSALDLASARDLVVGSKGSGKLGYICLCNAHSLGEAHRDPLFRDVLNQSWLTTPDGMPLVWWSRLAGFSEGPPRLRLRSAR